MRPLGHRIIVQPDKAPTVTESGFLIPESVNIPAMSGIVTAVGDGPMKATRLRHAVIRRCLWLVDAADRESGHGCSALDQLREQMVRYGSDDALDHHVQVGDRVLFAVESGHEIVLNEHTDDAIIILSEDDVLATLEG